MTITNEENLFQSISRKLNKDFDNNKLFLLDDFCRALPRFIYIYIYMRQNFEDISQYCKNIKGHKK